MRILLLSNELVPERAGGVATYTATIAPALAARGHDVHVLSCAPEHQRRDDEYDGVWWHRRRLIGGDRTTRANRFPQSAQRLATALSCLREVRPLGRFDVIESPEWLAQPLLVGALTHVPVVVNLHTPLRILFAFNVRRFNTDMRTADRLERAGVRRAAVVTAASRLLADTLRRDGWLTRDATIIPLPVDARSWQEVPPVATSGPTVLVVGRLERRKAPEVVVEAAEILSTDVPGLEVVFVGRSNGTKDGLPYGTWVEQLATRKGVSATFAPQTPHERVIEFYAKARVVAVPSHFESFSVAALEAIACGRPVVYSSGIGAAEILNGTDAGVEVPPGDAEALSAALRPYLIDEDRAAEAGDAARAVALARCAPDIIAAQRERCFEAAAAAGDRG